MGPPAIFESEVALGRYLRQEWQKPSPDDKAIITKTLAKVIDPLSQPLPDIFVLHRDGLDEQGQVINGALEALVQLDLITVKELTDVALKRRIVDRLASDLDRITDWMRFLLRYGLTVAEMPGRPPISNVRKAFVDHAARLDLLLLFDVKIRECFYSSTSSMDLVYRFWTVRDEHGEVMEDFDNPYGFPVQGLMSTCLRDQEGNQAFVDYLLSLPRKQLDTFVRLTLLRGTAAELRLYGKGPEGNRCSPSKALTYFRCLCSLVAQLVTDRRIHSVFTRHRAIKYLVTSSVTFGKVIKIPQELTLISLQLIFITLTHSHRVIQDLNDAVDFGLFRFILESLSESESRSTLVRNDQTEGWMKTVMSLLDVQVIWPSALATIWSEWLSLSPSRKAAISQLPGIGEQWTKLLAVIERRIIVMEDLNRAFILCDNPYCPSDSRRLQLDGLSMIQSKRCCGCHSFAYCSASCQEQDWKAYHRQECPAARVNHNLDKANLEWYPLRARAYHVALMEHEFNVYIARHFDPSYFTPPNNVARKDVDTFGPKTKIPHSKYFVLNMAYFGSKFVDISARDEGDPANNWEAGLNQRYLRNRLTNGFLNEAYDYGESANPSIKIVEGILAFGNRATSLILKVRLHCIDQTTGISRFYAVASLPRSLYGKDRNE